MTERKNIDWNQSVIDVKLEFMGKRRETETPAVSHRNHRYPKRNSHDRRETNHHPPWLVNSATNLEKEYSKHHFPTTIEDADPSSLVNSLTKVFSSFTEGIFKTSKSKPTFPENVNNINNNHSGTSLTLGSLKSLREDPSIENNSNLSLFFDPPEWNGDPFLFERNNDETHGGITNEPKLDDISNDEESGALFSSGNSSDPLSLLKFTTHPASRDETEADRIPISSEPIQPLAFHSDGPSKEAQVSPPKATTTSMATKLQSLPESERQQATLDLHGLSLTPREDPFVLTTKLQEMERHIVAEYCRKTHTIRNGWSKIVANTDSPLGWAYATAPSFVRKEAIKFLRAEGHYHPKGAVRRMSAYYEMKHKYFGKDALCRELTMQDLTPDDRTYLRYGATQFLEDRDRSGRAVFLLVGKLIQEIPFDSVARMMMYGSQIMTKDEQIQKQGYVHVCWFHGMTTHLASRKELHRTREMMILRQCLPVRCVAKHLCYHDRALDRSFYGALVHVLDPCQVVRLRFHCGSVTECVYNLMTYGISQDSLPFATDRHHEGNMTIDTEFHHAFLDAVEEREANDRVQADIARLEREKIQVEGKLKANAQIISEQEKALLRESPSVKRTNAPSSSNNETVVIVLPGPRDIIMGRGCHNKNKPGNVRLRKLLEVYRTEYDSASSKPDKTMVISRILDVIEESDSRFLVQQTPGKWIVASRQKAHDKVAHDFRNMRQRGVPDTVKETGR